MSKNIKYFYRSLVIIGVLCILAFPVTVRSQEGSSLEDLSELKTTVNIRVSWNQHDEYDGNLEETGSMSTSVTGTLIPDKQQKGVFLFFPGSDGMHAEVKYQNVTTDKETGELYLNEEGSSSVQVLSPRSLKDPQTQGHFEFMAYTGPAGRALALQLAGEVDPASMMKIMTSQENMDYFNFSVATPIQTVVTDKDGKSKKGLRGIHFALIAEKFEDGKISNSISWKAKKLQYSIEHQSFMATLYEPPKEEEGDVDYSVTWTFGDIAESPITENVDEDENKEKDCEKLQKRIDFIKIILKTYADQSLRDDFKKAGKTHKDYQAEVEKRVMEEAHSGNGDPGEAKVLMETVPLYNEPECTSINKIEIRGTVEGTSKTLISYDEKGNQVDDTEDFWKLQQEWEEFYGEEAGQCLFKAAVRHEECHVKQFVEKGKIESYDVDDRAERELEAFRIEKNNLEQDLVDLDC
jgi:hypothetical protein